MKVSFRTLEDIKKNWDLFPIQDDIKAEISRLIAKSENQAVNIRDRMDCLDVVLTLLQVPKSKPVPILTVKPATR